MKKCPQCAEEIQSEAKVCRFCGAKQIADGIAVAPPPAKNSFQSCMGCVGVVFVVLMIAMMAGNDLGNPDQAIPEDEVAVQAITPTDEQIDDRQKAYGYTAPDAPADEASSEQ